MMDNQPLNLLTTTTTNKQTPASSSSAQPGSGNATGSSSSCSSSGSSDQRQMALSNIFNSLSSLAAANSSHQQAPPEVSTLQSVMAAAMLQQQHQIHHPTSAKNLLAPVDQFNLYNNPEIGTNTQQQQQQQQQRINYCTICNKELCNKYFMKTHMIKMHGINLEMEPSDGDRDEEQDEEDNKGETGESGSERNSPDTETPQNFANNSGQEQQQQQQTGNSFDEPANIKQIKSTTKQAANPKKNQTQYTSSTQKKKPPTSSNNQSNKQTTSVLNGFAGNSMGGVVCDICNKELCSKYFLKVHKQNTHGIADYPEATNQFAMYPFPSSIAGPNPFLASATPTAISQGFNPFGMPNVNPMNIFSSLNNNTCEELSNNNMNDCSSHEKTNSAKKPRLSINKQQPSIGNSSSTMNDRKEECSDFNNSVSESPAKQQMDSVYRLLIAQQQQQQQQQNHHHQQLPTPIPSASAPPLIPAIDPMAAAALSAVNPLSALMCFGAVGPLGPFGTTGMSPATIVDNILRNQHLFNRNNNQQPPNASSSNHQSIINSKGADGNNNSDSNQNNPKSSKETSSNSRYFSHYTEACPMCDRRFKSIKWLKTHMMNDHKQEIGAYMQMMMQYLYTSKSQQMAAAATMAAIEQQQQQQHQHNLNINQQNLIRQLNEYNNPSYQHQDQMPTSQPSGLNNHKYGNFFDSFQTQPKACNNPATSMKQFQMGQIYQYASGGGDSPENMTGGQLKYISEEQRRMFLEDRTRRNDSISPEERDIKHSPSTSSIRQAHSSNGNKQLGLNFDLKSGALKREENDPLLSELTQNDSNDSAEDLSRDSNTTQEEFNQRVRGPSPAETKPNIEQGNHLSIKTTSSN